MGKNDNAYLCKFNDCFHDIRMFECFFRETEEEDRINSINIAYLCDDVNLNTLP